MGAACPAEGLSKAGMKQWGREHFRWLRCVVRDVDEEKGEFSVRECHGQRYVHLHVSARDLWIHESHQILESLAGVWRPVARQGIGARRALALIILPHPGTIANTRRSRTG